MTEPRRLLVPRDLEEKFLLQADENTAKGIETCGLLCGREEGGTIRVTHLMIPPQTGTPNTVEMVEDQLVSDAICANDLMIAGWIHTHPTQTAFLSSIDVHTQHLYQSLLKEAVAVVCAPFYGVVKWFRLTETGMRIIGGCNMDGFHDHAKNT